MSATFVPVTVRHTWEQVPAMDCRGLCTDSCGPIDASPAERAILASRGIDLPTIAPGQLARWAAGFEEPPACPALDATGDCTVYDVRPLICRMWGAIDPMPCPYGCEPAGGRLSHDTARSLLARLGAP